MIAHGDELGRTQQGNNNVYCQDNELSWVDWDLDEDAAGAARLHRRARRAAPRPPGVPPPPVLRRQRRPRRASPTWATSPGSSPSASTWARTPGATVTPSASWSSSTAAPSPSPTRAASRSSTTTSSCCSTATTRTITFTLPGRGVRRALGRRDRHAPSRSSTPTGTAPRSEILVQAAVRRRPARRSARPPPSRRAASTTTRAVQAMATTHRPDPGRVVPTATYRLQVHAGFGFDAAAEHVGYLAALGVSHAYLSPVLQAGAGLDPRLRRRRPRPGSARRPAGARRFDRLVAACREHGLGIIVDVVPNHMTVPEPAHLNAPLWSLLRDGRRSPVRATGSTSTGRPRTTASSCRCSAAPSRRRSRRASCSSPTTAGPRGRRARPALLRPRVPGAPRDRGAAAGRARRGPGVPALRLARGRRRRSTTGASSTSPPLAAVRVEDPDVFDATHALLLELLGHGPSTASGSTTPTASPTPAATSTGSPRPPATPGSSPRRSSRARSSSPTTGGAPARPGTTPCCGSQQVFVDPDGRAAGRSTGSGAQAAADRLDPRRRRAPQSKRLGRRRRPGGRGRPADAARAPRPRPASDPSALRRAPRGAARLDGPLPRLRRPRPRASTPSRPRVVEAAAERARARSSRRATTTPSSVVVRLVLGGRLPRGAGRRGPRGRRVRGAVPADLRPGDGQGHRGHRLLPLVPPRRRSTRSAATPTSRRHRHRRVPRLARRAGCERWPTDDDDADDPRHQALRGRPGPARPCSPRRPSEWATWLARGARRSPRAAPRRAARRPPPSTSCWQTLVGAWPITGARLEEYAPQGGARGQGPHGLGRRRRRRTRRPSSASSRNLLHDSADPEAPRRRGCWRTSRRVARRRSSARSSLQLDDARRPRRLPGLRGRRPLARRPRQPPPGRLDRPRRAPRRGSTPASPPSTSTTRSCWSPPRALRLRRDHPEGSSARRRPTPACATTSEHALAVRPRRRRRAAGRRGGHPRGRAARRRPVASATPRSTCPPVTWRDVLSEPRRATPTARVRPAPTSSPTCRSRSSWRLTG